MLEIGVVWSGFVKLEWRRQEKHRSSTSLLNFQFYLINIPGRNNKQPKTSSTASPILLDNFLFLKFFLEIPGKGDYPFRG